MKPLLFLFAPTIALSFCSEPKPITNNKTESSVAENDPYFIASTDTVSQYGPKCITRDLLQDKNGNFWFATWQGIIGYDGHLFTNYTLQNKLAQFHVLDAYEDRNQNLWFAMAGGGVYRYNGKTFTRFTTHDGLVDNYVICITEDNAGKILFGTAHGACAYDGKTFTALNGTQSRYVNSILQDKSGKFWIGTTTGLYACNSWSATLVPITETDRSELNVWSLYEDKTGKIWIGKINGLTVYDPASATINKNALNDTLPLRLTYYITSDKKGNVLLAHSEASSNHPNYPTQILYRYDDNRFTRIAEKGDPDDFQIFGNMEDNAGNIWFGTMKGPCKYDGKNVISFYE